jgi:hypothetical protein
MAFVTVAVISIKPAVAMSKTNKVVIRRMVWFANWDFALSSEQ